MNIFIIILLFIVGLILSLKSKIYRPISFVLGVFLTIFGFYFLKNNSYALSTIEKVLDILSLGFGFGLIFKSAFRVNVSPIEDNIVTNSEIKSEKTNSVISIKNITKDYFSGVKTTALSKINLNIEKGEFVAIMGQSGSGKSTLMHILGLLDSPTSGTYFLADKEVSTLNSSEQAEARNKYIGFVFQQFNLLPRTTVLDNVLLPTIYNHVGDARNKAELIIKKVGLENRINHKSNELSGGQIQRVAIARALMMEPDIILADEPTGNLDSKTSVEIMDLFKEINKEGTTIIMVTHEEDIAKNAERIIRLKDGEIISDIKK